MTTTPTPETHKPIRCGVYLNGKEEAARAYDAAAKRLHGAFAKLNFSD